ncbi:APC family permease [Henriciella sp. AS95]|uniref:APC family permease n=1 Tax=Henriciella sp. AS95 TaxID=3135782 RepID=UPI0031712075
MTEEIRPPRVVGTIGATLMSVNGMIGAGIFALPAILYAETGNFAPWMFLIFGLLFSCNILVASRMAAMFRSSGGVQLYAQAAFGPIVGFQVGWLLVIAISAGRAATLHVLVSYLSVFFPFLQDGPARIFAVLALLIALSALTTSGMRNAVAGIMVGTVLKVTPILLLCVVAFAVGGLSVSFELPSFGTFESVALLVYFAFSGTINSTYSAGEIKNPRRTLPRSMLLSLAAIIVLYMAVQWAYIAAGAPSSAGNAAPLAAAAGAVMGETGVVILTLAAIFSITTNALTFFVSGPRIIYGMADRGLLPKTLAHVSDHFRTPDRAILLFTLIVAMVSLSGNFTFLAKVTSLGAQIAILSMFAAFVYFQVRGREGHDTGLTPVWVLIVFVGVAFSIYASAQAPLEAFGLIAGLIVIGTLLSFVARRNEIEKPAPIVD